MPPPEPIPLADRVAGLQSRLDAFRRSLEPFAYGAPEPVFMAATQEFLEFVRTYPDEEAYAEWERGDSTAQFRAFFAPRVLRFTAAVERQTHAELLAKSGGRAGGPMGPLLGANRWGAYARMADILAHLDLAACRTFLMAGCGPVPDSLFCVHDHTSVERLVGTDRDPRTVGMARQLVNAFGLTRIRIEQADAGGTDYGDVDAICCSAFLAPRRAIMERIASTAREGCSIILRDPFFTGTLLFERALDALPPRLAVVKELPAARSRFMLKYYLLRAGTRSTR